MDNLSTKFLTIVRHPDLGKRPLARQIGVSPNTAARYKALATAFELNEAAIARLGDSGIARLIHGPCDAGMREPVWDSILVKLQAGQSRKEAYEDFKAECADESVIAYRTFCKRIAELLTDREPVMRLVHTPGAAVMVDFAGYRPPALGPDSEGMKVELFVGVLPASGYVFACAVLTQSTEDWVWANVAMLEAMGGVPRKIICDNLKAAVLACPKGKPPRLNSVFAAMCEHYSLIAQPARVRRPRDKGSVEAHVKIVQARLARKLASLPLLPLAELNRVIARVIDDINDAKIRRLVTEKRRVLFKTFEQSALAPLPAKRFEHFVEVRLRKLPRDYHIVVGKVAYSAPHELIGRPVMARVFHNHVEIWHDGRQIACHRRVRIENHIETIDRHRPEGHRSWTESGNDDFVAWAVEYGDNVRRFVAAEAARDLRGAARHNQYRAIVRLPREFGRPAFEQACAMAAANGALRLSIVRNILENNRISGDLKRRPATRPSATANVRGPAYYAKVGRNV